MTSVLIVEDDCDIRSMLERGLAAEGFDVAVADRAEVALATARTAPPNAIVLDIMLPDGSGHDVCRSLRGEGFKGPILFLSAKDEVGDRVEGLSLGADDYIVKPFDFVELLARLRTQMKRREGTADPNVLSAGRLSLDLTVRQARFGSTVARLTQREAELLSALMQKPNRPLSRATSSTSSGRAMAASPSTRRRLCRLSAHQAWRYRPRGRPDHRHRARPRLHARSA